MNGLTDGHAAHHAQNHATNQVDGSDDQPGYGIPADKLAGAVHSTVKLRLTHQLLPTPACFRFINAAAVQFRINGHLLAWQGVEGKTCCYFRNAIGAFGDHHKLNHHQNQKHYQTNHKVPCHHEVAERIYDRTRLSLQQNLPRGGDVQRQPDKRQQQQHRREHGKIERLLDGKHDQQHQQCQGKITGQQQINAPRRQRHQQHDQHAQHCRCQGPFAALSKGQIAIGCQGRSVRAHCYAGKDESRRINAESMPPR
jgi:hypothetical protein